MKQVLFIVGLSLHITSFSQPSKKPVEVTAELQKTIIQGIDKEVLKLTQRLQKENVNTVHMEFTIDTFRIERFMAKWVDLDYSDFGM